MVKATKDVTWNVEAITIRIIGKSFSLKNITDRKRSKGHRYCLSYTTKIVIKEEIRIINK